MMNPKTLNQPEGADMIALAMAPVVMEEAIENNPRFQEVSFWKGETGEKYPGEKAALLADVAELVWLLGVSLEMLSEKLPAHEQQAREARWLALAQELAGSNARLREALAKAPPSAEASKGERKKLALAFAVMAASVEILATREGEIFTDRGEGQTLRYRWQGALREIRSVAARLDPKVEQAFKSVGEAYAEGRLSLVEASQAVKLPVWEVIPRFEQLGFYRTGEAARLPQEKRDSLYQQMRESRLRRQGQPAPSEERVARAVIASQRIEDVDARQWLNPLSPAQPIPAAVTPATNSND
jgi:hypothetical protein